MKTMFFTFLFCLALGSVSQAQYILTSEHGGPHNGGGHVVHPPNHGGGNHNGGGAVHHNPTGHGGQHYGGQHYGHHNPAPGWSHTYVYNYHYYPRWYYAGFVFPVWYWAAEVPVGYWQCTAFNQELTPFYATGMTEHQAAYNAMYACGGPSASAMGCYVPEGYCRLR
jgi:hypothetical protein